MDELLKSQGPVLIRYALNMLFTWLMTHGAISAEAHSYLGGQMDVLVGIVGNISVILYALWRRPSAVALEAAKEIDKKVIPLQKQHDMAVNPNIVIKTPVGFPDVVIPIFKKAA